MEKNEQGVREAIAELLDNLGVIGDFMLGEARSFLVKSWGASREEFFVAVDQIAKSMKQSGKMAVEDIDRAADKIKQSFDLLIQDQALNFESFTNELNKRLDDVGTVSKETFDSCVDRTAETLDQQWTNLGRVGEDQVKYAQNQIGAMAEFVKSQWDVSWETMQQTGNKVERALNAAWEELKK